MKRLIIITGATACGKTSTSVKLAKQLGTEIVSCDSRQFYQEMSIGTAKPTLSEMDGVIHHCINSHSIQNEISAGKFEELALPLLNQLFQKYDDVILTGGSGLFIDAVVKGFDEMPKVNPEVRSQLNDQLSQKGLNSLVDQLKEIDPDFCEEADLKNPMRVIRALEVCLSTGKPFSSFRVQKPKKRPFSTLKIVLDWPREMLYARINQRVDLMVKEGLEQEVKNLLPHREKGPLKTVGYQELFSFYDGDISKDEAFELIKRNSRRYAKRQLTWFRRDENYHWVDATDFDSVIELVTSNTSSN